MPTVFRQDCFKVAHYCFSVVGYLDQHSVGYFKTPGLHISGLLLGNPSKSRKTA